MTAADLVPLDLIGVPPAPPVRDGWCGDPWGLRCCSPAGRDGGGWSGWRCSVWRSTFVTSQGPLCVRHAKMWIARGIIAPDVVAEVLGAIELDRARKAQDRAECLRLGGCL